jgi:hypothetical protein
MRKNISILIILILNLTACKNTDTAHEIIIPVYENGNVLARTVTAEIMDLSSQKVIPAGFGCPFAESVLSPVDGNLIEFNPARKEFKKDEIIAVIDSSDLIFEKNNQQSAVNSALNRYNSSGSERDRLNYLIELEELNRITAVIEKYTVKAPYDCVIIFTSDRKTGEYINKGELFFIIARPDEVYIYVSGESKYFAVGMFIDITMGSFAYKARVVSCPSSSPSYSTVNYEQLTVIKPEEGELARIYEDTPGALNAGWATVYVTVHDKRNVLAVRDSAVTSGTGSPSQGMGSFCVMQSGGERLRVAVETGDSVNGFTIILNGLHEGDEVFC